MNDETMRELIRQGRGPVDDCTCPPSSVDDPTPPDPNCPGVIRDRRQRSHMAAAWDDGMAAHTQGLGSDDNPYRQDPNTLALNIMAARVARIREQIEDWHSDASENGAAWSLAADLIERILDGDEA